MTQLQFAQVVGFKGTLVYTATVAIPDGAVTHTWTRANLGYDFSPGATGLWTWGNSFTQPITLGGDFAVMSSKPKNNAENVDPKDPGIEVSFNKPYKQSSLNTGTFKVEYRNAGGAYTQVNGTVSHLSDTRARFVPSGAGLMDGVFYRLTIKGGEGGVIDKGDPADPLDNDHQYRFSTMVDLTNNVEVHSFQVSRDEKLVPKKSTLVRVYANWTVKAGVHADDQVKKIKAKVTVEDGTGAAIKPSRNVEIKRPDLYNEEDKKNARNSVNFFGWKPTSANSSPLKAKVEPLNQQKTPPKVYEGTRAITYWDKSPTLKFSYYFFKVGAWSAGIPEAAKTSAIQLATSGGVYTTQNFPALSTTATNIGDFVVAVPDSVKDREIGGKTRRYYWNDSTWTRVDGYIGRKLYDSAIAAGSTADVIVGFIPQNFQLGITGVAFNFGGGKRVVLVVQGSANASTVAHEFAHFFKQGHDATNNIEAFRIASSGLSGWNKSKTEGNQQAGALKSLMTPVINPVAERMILNTQYSDLFNHVTAAPAPPLLASLDGSAVFEFMASQLGEPYLVISGSIDVLNGRAQIEPMKMVELDNPPTTDPGAFTLELLDVSGAVLSSTSFGVFEADPYHGDGATDGMYSVIVPYLNAIAKVVIKSGSTIIGEFARSASTPEIAFTSPSAGSALAGQHTVQWTGTDLDGDTIYYTLLYRAAGTEDWMPLAADITDTSFVLDTGDLPSGDAPTFRLQASDGFNTAESTVAFSLSNSLTIVATSPAEGETVTTRPSLTVFFNTVFDTGQIRETTFVLQDASSNIIPSEVAFDEITRTATLTPRSALRPDAEYTASIQEGIVDRYGNSLTNTFSWSFRTETDTEAPRIERTFPDNGAIGVNPSSIIRIEFDENLKPVNVFQTYVTLVDSQGNTVSGTTVNFSHRSLILFTPDSPLTLGETYEATATSQLIDEAGNAFEGPYSWTFTTSNQDPGAAEINGYFRDFGLDSNGDGFYDSLEIEVGLTLLEPMSIRLLGSLRDANGTVFSQAEATATHQPGDHQLVLSFSGTDISRNGVSGSFTLGPVYLYNAGSDHWELLDFGDEVYQTGTFTIDQFVQSNAALQGTYTDEGVDDDGNGLFDRLVITTTLVVNKQGSYRMRGQLFDSNGFFIAAGETAQFFNSPGNYPFAFSFAGSSIRGHGDASPYQLRFVDLFDANNVLLGTTELAYTTSAYTGDQFETSLADLRTFPDQIVLVDEDPSDQIVNIRVQIFNFGGTAVDQTDVRLMVDGIQLGSDFTLFNIQGTPQEIIAPWDFSQSSGSASITVDIDIGGTVDELNEFNNTTTVTVSLPLENIPSQPTDLQASYSEANTSVSLTWQPPIDAWTGFFVYRRLAGTDGPFVRQNAVHSQTASYADSDVQEGGTYDYAVSTFVSGQPSREGPQSSVLEFKAALSLRFEGAVFISPVDGAQIVIGGAPGTIPMPLQAPFVVEWNPAVGAEGPTVTYTWQLSTIRDFSTCCLINEEVGANTRFETELSTIASILDGQGVSLGGSVSLFHRVVVSDGQTEFTSSASSMILVRGLIVGTDVGSELPADFVLRGNYPNPFNPSTNITFDLPDEADISLAIFDVMGRRVMNVPPRPFSAGHARSLRIDVRQLSSGLYIYRIRARTRGEALFRVGKMTIVK